MPDDDGRGWRAERKVGRQGWCESGRPEDCGGSFPGFGIEGRVAVVAVSDGEVAEKPKG